MTIKELLCKPFAEEEHEWRVQSCGIKSNGEPWVMVLCYVQARPIQERLDEVFGINGWCTEYIEFKDGIICRLSIKDHDEFWLHKEDGAPVTDIEPFKGGISDAFKRVASSGYGIGRYLYNLDTTFANCSTTKEKNWKTAKTKDNKYIYWQTPKLPAWAFTANAKQPPKEKPNEDKTETEGKNKELINTICEQIMELANDDVKKAPPLLLKLTTFQGKDGKVVNGTNNTADLYKYSEKRLQVLHGKLKKELAEKSVGSDDAEPPEC